MRLLREVLLVLTLQMIPILASKPGWHQHGSVESVFNGKIIDTREKACQDCLDYCVDRTIQLDGPDQYVAEIQNMVKSVPAGQDLDACLAPCTEGMKKTLHSELVKLAAEYHKDYPALDPRVLARSKAIIPTLKDYRCIRNDGGRKQRRRANSPAPQPIWNPKPNTKASRQKGPPREQDTRLGDWVGGDGLDDLLGGWSTNFQNIGNGFIQQMKKQNPKGVLDAMWKAAMASRSRVPVRGMQRVPIPP
ncbi:MAG: hypothetical protein M1823_006151 [Watsoniomyces obsoletus]|nr:MAG: hypothetical protein M1823_006151 [Watsoniomyces obsoletus]